MSLIIFIILSFLTLELVWRLIQNTFISESMYKKKSRLLVCANTIINENLIVVFIQAWKKDH